MVLPPCDREWALSGPEMEWSGVSSQLSDAIHKYMEPADATHLHDQVIQRAIIVGKIYL
jgi:hypothetical protein